MVAPEEINADMLAFWNGNGGHTWVTRQEHTDITLAPVTDALLAFAAPCADERVVDIGCVWRAHAGVCARRRSLRPRGGVGHLRADAGRG